MADEPLGAVDDVLVPVAHRARPDAGGIGPGIGLGQGEGDQLVAGREARQPAGLLLAAARDLDRDRPQRLDREDEARGRAVAADLLDREAQREQVPAQPAVLLGERDGKDVVVRQEPAHVLWPLGGAVDVRRPGGDLLVGQHAHGVTQEDLLLREAHGSVDGLVRRHRGHRSSVPAGPDRQG
jgi:hypothetical protein